MTENLRLCKSTGVISINLHSSRCAEVASLMKEITGLESFENTASYFGGYVISSYVYSPPQPVAVVFSGQIATDPIEFLVALSSKCSTATGSVLCRWSDGYEMIYQISSNGKSSWVDVYEESKTFKLVETRTGTANVL